MRRWYHKKTSLPAWYMHWRIWRGHDGTPSWDPFPSNQSYDTQHEGFLWSPNVPNFRCRMLPWASSQCSSSTQKPHIFWSDQASLGGVGSMPWTGPREKEKAKRMPDTGQRWDVDFPWFPTKRRGFGHRMMGGSTTSWLANRDEIWYTGTTSSDGSMINDIITQSLLSQFSRLQNLHFPEVMFQTLWSSIIGSMDKKHLVIHCELSELQYSSSQNNMGGKRERERGREGLGGRGRERMGEG